MLAVQVCVLAGWREAVDSSAVPFGAVVSGETTVSSTAVASGIVSGWAGVVSSLRYSDGLGEHVQLRLNPSYTHVCDRLSAGASIPPAHRRSVRATISF
jgi:hypothetical protein